MAVAPLGDVQRVPLAQVRPYPANARNIPSKAVDQVKKSLLEFGWQQPIVTDPDYVIIVGHVRWGAAKSLRLRSVPVVVADQLTEEQVRAYRIADNRTHDYTTWDYGILARELDGLAGFSDVLDLTDWRILTDEFEGLPEPLAGIGAGEQSLFGREFSVTVLFSSAEEADAAGPEIMKIAGVLDVCHAYR